MLKKDAIWFGIFLGMILPAVFGGILYVVDLIIRSAMHIEQAIHTHDLLLLSVIINLLPIRIYFVNLKYDRTGRGILLVTFILIILFFIFIRPL
jgi:hypothetical protein